MAKNKITYRISPFDEYHGDQTALVNKYKNGKWKSNIAIPTDNLNSFKRKFHKAPQRKKTNAFNYAFRQSGESYTNLDIGDIDELLK